MFIWELVHRWNVKRQWGADDKGEGSVVCAELHAGRVDPRVGSGRVRKFTNMSGSGRVWSSLMNDKNLL